MSKTNSWPLVGFERYLLADDRHDLRSGRGMVFPMIFRLRGIVQSVLWQHAVTLALARHPLLASRLSSERKQSVWHPQSDLAAMAELASERHGGHPSGRVDLQTGPPFTFAAVQHGDAWDACFQFHHAAVDGIGALQFVGDCLAHYQKLTTQATAISLPELEPNTLTGRGKPAVPATVSPQRSVAGLSLGDEVKRFFLRRVQPVRPPQLDTSPVDCRSAGGASQPRSPQSAALFCDTIHDLYQIEIDEPSADAIRFAVTAASVTVNDAAMCALMLSLYRSNSQRAGWYRLTMPSNLRDRQQRLMPACNRIGYAFIDRFLDPDVTTNGLLQSLAAENSAIRNQLLASGFLGVLDSLQRVPGLMRLATSSHLRATTAVFSNIGDPTRRFHWRYRQQSTQGESSPLQILGFAGAPPVRPKTPASFLLHQLSGRIYLNVLIDQQRLSADHAMQLLHGWRDQLVRL